MVANMLFQHIGVFTLFSGNRYDIDKLHAFRKLQHVQHHFVAIFDLIDLVHTQHHREVGFLQLSEHHLVISGPVSTFNDKQH
ncbi:Uncharacterised protein [Vibrio cholerae]|nr:Uncharacterised protein [Vibrio cholerae]CSB35611.1 Uncharacterised protein [Vibrio cholerae]CSB37229.1 Uncharacterised protein [Vibrio cholerae]CSB55374.1 Uncharacterised protein [Vibrio cholerae]CSB58313.1 Uncharacterised protein [Vibrio cholerae]